MTMKETVEKILTENDIVEVISEYVELTPIRGSRFKGVCPFCHGKDLKFKIDHARQAYYCFDCEKHGDVITFLKDHMGLSFWKAVKELALRAEIELPEMPDNA